MDVMDSAMASLGLDLGLKIAFSDLNSLGAEDARFY